MIGTRQTIQKNNTVFIAPFIPLDWQIAPWRDKTKILLLTGSAGGGKSRLAAEKMHAFCKKYSGSMGLMLRKTRNSMTNSTVLFMEKTVIGDDPSVTHYPSKNRFEYTNGSILAYGGMANEEQREQIRSIGQGGSVDVVWMEEANRFTEDDYQELLGRLRGKAAGWRQVILTTNPDAPTHWIKRRLMDGNEAAVYYSGAVDNPHNPDEYRDTLASFTGILGKRLNLGLWVQAEGVVYEQFSDELHVIDPFEIPEDWQRIRSIDFGFTNPFICQWYAIDPDGRMYLYREIYMSQRLVEDHARQINGLSENENIWLTVADHDAEDRATLQKYGVSTQPAKKDVSPGIQAVQARLVKAGDGKPGLFVVRGATVETDRKLEANKLPVSTLEEFPGYVWPETKDGKEAKEAPVKLNDHGMDALRYAVMAVDAGAQSILIGRVTR